MRLACRTGIRPGPGGGTAPGPAPPRRGTGRQFAIEDLFDDEGIGILTAATVVSVSCDTTARSAIIKTAAGPERELAYAQILVAAGRPVTGGPQFVTV